MDKKIQDFLKNSNVSFDQLISIFYNSYDGVLLTDEIGLVLFINPSCSVYMGIPAEEIINRKLEDLIAEGIYDRSVALEAIRTKKKETAIVHVHNGNRVVSTSTPILDKSGNVVMTVTNVRVEDVLNQYAIELQKEKRNSDAYKSVINYINRVDDLVIAESIQMKRIIEHINIISNTDSSILLLGESGTGKEVLSRLIHEKSNRYKEPFIPVNCAAIPKELMESEFFGYEKGAFSGALPKGKSGFFEMAHKGTLFLDEIGLMPLDIQSKFLRVLESGEVQRLGANGIIETDVRIICATNEKLMEKVKDKIFREDLYYRINVFQVRIPPLRERVDDIIPLANYFLSKLNSKYNLDKEFSPYVIDRLRNYRWPGNVRELKNIVERFTFTQSDNALFDQVDPIDDKMIEAVSSNDSLLTQSALIGKDMKTVIHEVEKKYITLVLKEHDWKVTEAAKTLGLHRSMVYRKINEYGIKKI